MEVNASQANPMQTGVGEPSDVPPLQESAVDPQDGEMGENNGAEGGDQEGSCSRGRKRSSVADLVMEERASTRRKKNHYSVLCDYQGSDYIFRHGGVSATLVSQISELERPAPSFRDLTFPEAYEEFASSELQVGLSLRDVVYFCSRGLRFPIDSGGTSLQHIGKKNRLIFLYDDKVKALQAEVAQQKTELETVKEKAEEVRRNAARVAGRAQEKEEMIKDLKAKLEVEITARRNDVSTALTANKKLLAEKAELDKKLQDAEKRLELESARLRKSRTDEVHKAELDLIRRSNARLRRIKAQVGDLKAYCDARVREREVSGLLACLKQIKKDGVAVPEDLMADVAKDAEERRRKREAIKYEPISDVIFDLGFNVPGEATAQLGELIMDQHGSNAGLISPQAATQLRGDVVGTSQSL